jgi:elongation factor P
MSLRDLIVSNNLFAFIERRIRSLSRAFLGLLSSKRRCKVTHFLWNKKQPLCPYHKILLFLQPKTTIELKFTRFQSNNQDMINAQDIKNGTCIRMDGRLYFCVEFLHVKPGKGNTFMRTKLKDVVDGRVIERRFNIGEKLEDVRVERRPYQYLYAEGGDDIFMNNETFEQIPISKELVTGAAFMKEGDTVEVVSDASTETVLYAEMPMKTILKITYTEPGLKGDTATNTLKPATVETGATVRVPLFVNEGELIEVDTRDGSYVSRVKA